jgi:hypothetical protein
MSEFEFPYSGEPEYSVGRPTPPPAWIHVSKSGGGTVGEAYEGYWDTALVFDGHTVDCIEYATSGESALYTGTPKTHAEVARIYAGFAAERLASQAEELDEFAAEQD